VLCEGREVARVAVQRQHHLPRGNHGMGRPLRSCDSALPARRPQRWAAVESWASFAPIYHRGAHLTIPGPRGAKHRFAINVLPSPPNEDFDLDLETEEGAIHPKTAISPQGHPDFGQSNRRPNAMLPRASIQIASAKERFKSRYGPQPVIHLEILGNHKRLGPQKLFTAGRIGRQHNSCGIRITLILLE
jgi:hypothetical protein